MVGDGGAWESAGAWRYRLYVRGELPFLLPARAAAGGASRQSRLLGRPAAERAARCARKGGVGWISTTALRRSEEHTSELQSLMRNSYAVFCLKNKIKNKYQTQHILHRQR